MENVRFNWTEQESVTTNSITLTMSIVLSNYTYINDHFVTTNFGVSLIVIKLIPFTYACVCLKIILQLIYFMINGLITGRISLYCKTIHHLKLLCHIHYQTIYSKNVVIGLFNLNANRWKCNRWPRRCCSVFQMNAVLVPLYQEIRNWADSVLLLFFIFDSFYFYSCSSSASLFCSILNSLFFYSCAFGNEFIWSSEHNLNLINCILFTLFYYETYEW